MGKEAKMEAKMKEREVFLDRLRVAATCAVVMLHTATGAMDITDMTLYPAQQRVFYALLDVIGWCVPVFLMISGYLFLNPAKEIGMKRMVTKYCRRILLALFGFGAPYALLEQIATERSFRPDMVGRSFLMVLRGESWSHMWYLYRILFLYLLTPAVKWILARVPRWTVYMALSLLLAVCSLLPCLCRLLGLEWADRLPEEGIYFFYYVCGYLFATGIPADCSGQERAGAYGGLSEAGHRPGTDRKGMILLILAALLAAAMGYGKLSGGITLVMAYNYPLTVLLALLIFGGAKLSRRKASQRGEASLKQLGQLSFAVYLVHPVFLNLAYKFLHVTPLSVGQGISLPIFFLATLLLAGGIAWVLYQIPLLRKYVI